MFVYTITVIDGSEMVGFYTLPTASEMEDEVTKLHKVHPDAVTIVRTVRA